MKDKNGCFESHGIDGAISASDIILNNLKYSGTAEALKHLCGVMLITSLSEG